MTWLILAICLVAGIIVSQLSAAQIPEGGVAVFIMGAFGA